MRGILEGLMIHPHKQILNTQISTIYSIYHAAAKAFNRIKRRNQDIHDYNDPIRWGINVKRLDGKLKPATFYTQQKN